MKLPRWLHRFLDRLLPPRPRKKAQATPPVTEHITDSGYYREISHRYTSVQVVLLMTLAVFVGVSLIRNAEAMSVDQLVYFIKDIGNSMEMGERAASGTLVYSADDSNCFGLYRRGLTVLGKNKMTIFTATGRESYSEAVSFVNPRVVGDGRYLLAYDLGQKEYRLYNSFTCLRKETTTSPIRGASVSATGYYCLITDGDVHTSEVTLYNSSFHMINRYRFQEYTVCAALREDGGKLATASVFSDGGVLVTRIMVATPGKDKEDASWDCSDLYPVSLSFSDDGNVMLLSTDGFYVYSAEGKLLSKQHFFADEVLFHRLSADGCVLFEKANFYDEKILVRAFDKSGQMLYNITCEGAVEDALLTGETLLILREDGIFLCDSKTPEGREIPLAGTYTHLMGLDSSDVYACGTAKAIRISAAQLEGK